MFAIDFATTSSAIMYQLCVLVMFTMVYYSMGLTKNFNMPTHSNDDPGTAFYFAIVTQTTVGYGDIHPKTAMARSIVTLHLAMTWFPMLVQFSGGGRQ